MVDSNVNGALIPPATTISSTDDKDDVDIMKEMAERCARKVKEQSQENAVTHDICLQIFYINFFD